MNNKRALILGGGGSIGSELVRQLYLENEVMVVDMDETRMFDLVEELGVDGMAGDIADIEVVERAFKWNPQIVFQCAARKTVTPGESNPIEHIRTNVLGTYNVIEKCKERGVAMVNISTDKVLGNSIMGTTKKLAERMVKNAGFNSVRFGNVMGSRGSVIPLWQKQMDEGKPLTVTDPRMTRFMMTIPQAVELIIKASEMPQDGRIVILDMGEPVSILNLAKEIIQCSGKDVGIKEIGIRAGESLTETLMTEEEKGTAIRENNFWII